MINKILAALLAFATLNVAQAHDFWVFGENSDKFRADIGYGHNFPHQEIIPKDEAKSFVPLAIISKDGVKTELIQIGENYRYEGERLKKGSYILAGEYKSTFWSKDANGKWYMDKTKDQVADSAYCMQASMYAKEVVNIDGEQDEFVTKTIGQKLEIVPLENPANFDINKPFKIQILLEGKPLKTARIDGTFDKFLKDKFAFSATTDLEGITEVMALAPGKWILKVMHKRAFGESKRCDEEILIASFTFKIK
ncbi:DUF4198 domain-containing protein [Campylobacter sp. RM16188]|uniref:DUF4198 domain-containing protein n=1 Tax=Campylobacter sp. RM16188 TaxID=1705725 RepID=UPI001C12F65E|nr:DUF4198 domain-containing protein [Campylobacter sp. RM16188]